MFPHRVIPKAVVYLVQEVLKNREADTEPVLQDIFDVLLTFEEAPANKVTVETLRSKLLGIEYPDSLFQFMYSLIDIMEEKMDETGTEITILDGASVFGLFVRRCRIEYFQSTVQETNVIFEIYRAYVTQTADNRSLENLLTDEKRNDSKWMAYADNDSPTLDYPTRTRQPAIEKDPLPQIGGWVSVNQIDTFLTRQAELIEKTGTSDISPTLLHQYLVHLQKNAPDINKIYQVRFLNYIRTGEYEGAVSNLHRFFAYCFSTKGTPMYHYALLNLGVLEAKFGHSRAALYALEEAVKAARECQDDDCLNEIRSWIYYVKGALNDQYRIMDRVEITTGGKPEKMENSIYLHSIYKLSQAQGMLQRGDPPAIVFGTLFQCNIQASMHGIGYIGLPYNMIKFKTWKHYGNSVLSETYMKMALQENEGTMDDREKMFLMASEMYYINGEYSVAMGYLEDFAKLHPEQTAMSLEWKQAYLKVQARLDPTHALQNTLDGQLQHLDLLQPERRQRYFETLHKQAEHYVTQEDYETALRILEDVYQTLKDSDHVSLLAKNLTLRAQLYLDNGEVETTIEILEESLTTSKKAHDAFNYYQAAIKLANGYLELSNDTEKALYLIECSTPNILSLGSQELIREMDAIYKKALDAHRNKHQHHDELL
ncbi:unnamed protein product [Absidia cylindrospora]